MKQNLYVKSVGLAIFFTFSLSMVTAQTSLNASGGNISGSDGTISYSVGQVIYQTQTGTNGTATPGVQQPFEISVVSAIDENEKITLTASIYPNPTADYIILSIEEHEKVSYNYQLFANTGQLLKTEKILSKQTNIDMQNLIQATYFLKVMQENKEIRTFKIIKY
jgi:hypothetical protein